MMAPSITKGLLMRKALSAAVLGLVGMVAWFAAEPARAGLLDGLFGGGSTGEPAKADARRRTWILHDFSTIRLVPREPDSQVNQHPVEIKREVLRQQLSQVRFTLGSTYQPLFTSDEVSELIEPLTQALGNAGPGDDVLLLSSARRGDAVLFQPVAVTARLFVRGGSLQFIVNDARFEFYNNYVGSRKQPEFTYGSRTRTGKAVLQSESANTVRPDWLAIPLTVGSAPTAGVAPIPTTTAPPSPTPAVATPAAPAAAAAPVVPLPRPRDPGFADEVEQRLVTLKRLRDRGLISEDEYQQKRREILQLL